MKTRASRKEKKNSDHITEFNIGTYELNCLLETKEMYEYNISQTTPPSFTQPTQKTNQIFVNTYMQVF